MSEQRPSALAEVEALAGRYPDIPIEAIFKEDLLRRGWRGRRGARGRVPLQAEGVLHLLLRPGPDRPDGPGREPQGARGDPSLGRAVRVSPGGRFGAAQSASPYRVECLDGAPAMQLEGRTIAGVELQKSPEYYRRSLSSGKPIIDIAPTIEWGTCSI